MKTFTPIILKTGEYFSEPFLRKSKSGKWVAVLKYKQTEKGAWKQTTKTLKAEGKREANREAKEFKSAMEKQARSVPSVMPLANGELTVEMAIRNYLDYQLHVEHTLELSTYSHQLDRCKRHIFPYIGSYGFDGLTRITIQNWLSELSKKGLSAGYIYNVFSIPSKVYTYHYMCEDITSNPFDHVRTPPKGRAKVTHLTPEQQDNVILAIEDTYETGSRNHITLYLGLYTGMRRGEICGLMWHCVDFNSRTIEVSSAIGTTPHTSYIKTPKTRASIRTIPIVDQLYPILLARYERVKANEGYVDPTWFVTGVKGRYTQPAEVTRMFRVFVKEHNLVDHKGNYINMRALRHNFATVGVRSRMDIKSLQSVMGHSSAAMTLDTYADSSPDAIRQAMEKLSETMHEESEWGI